MESDSGSTKSYWMATCDVWQPEPLSQSTQADVCVVGAGITGLTCAYLLAREGRSVLVLEDGLIGGGETQRTTAHLSNEVDDRYTEIERMHGQKKAQLVFDSHTAAIDLIERITLEEKIECDFTRLGGYLFLSPGGKPELLQREYEAAARAGFIGIQQLTALPFQSGKGTPCLRFPNQAQFHVLKYLDGLARACANEGVRLYRATHVSTVEGGQPVVLKTNAGHAVHAAAAIVATNSPIHGTSEFLKQAAYRTYAIAGRIPKGSVPLALYWDTEDPYHYIRLQKCDDDPSSDILIIGGADHKVGQEPHPEKHFDSLKRFADKHFPLLKQVDWQWSGEVYEPVDGLAFIGKDASGKKNVYMATGDSGQGMTHGTMAGIIIRDLILGRANPWIELYDPKRKPLAAPVEFIRENLNTGLQYTRNLLAGDVRSVDQIAPGQGAVISHEGEKIAVYRDHAGQVQQMSALCPHMGAVVAWNDVEKSWDCPAHGSRFSATGKVVDGPANEDLGPCKNCIHIPMGQSQKNIVPGPHQSTSDQRSA